MRGTKIASALVFVPLLLAASPLNGGDVLKMQVSPRVSVAPGYMTVRVRVEAAPGNRLLEVIADSGDFYRSSQVPLAGTKTPLNIIEFRNLPTGLYNVTSVLTSTRGRQATAAQQVQVTASTGR